MWLILACSVLGLSVVIDRFLVLRKAMINVPSFMVRLRGLIKKKDISGAVSVCMQENSPIANIVRNVQDKSWIFIIFLKKSHFLLLPRS